MTPIKVAMCGAQGTGKTTAVMVLAERIRKEHPGTRVAVVTGVARRCPWAVNEKSTAEAQRWIFHKQIAEELSAATSGARVILCDRSVLDSLAYAFLRWNNEAGKEPWGWLPSYLSLFYESWLKSYSRIWFFRPFDGPVPEDGFRSGSKAFQLRVDEQIDKLLYFAHDGVEMRAREWAGLDEAMTHIKELL